MANLSAGELTLALTEAFRKILLPELKRIGGSGGGAQSASSNTGGNYGSHSSVRSKRGSSSANLDDATNEIANFDVNAAKAFKTLLDGLEKSSKNIQDIAKQTGKSAKQIEEELSDAYSDYIENQRDFFQNLNSNALAKLGTSEKDIIDNMRKTIMSSSKMFSNRLQQKIASGTEDVTKDIEDLFESSVKNAKTLKEAKDKEKAVFDNLKKEIKSVGTPSAAATLGGVNPGVANASINVGQTIDQMMVNAIYASSIVLTGGPASAPKAPPVPKPEPIGKEISEAFETAFSGIAASGIDSSEKQKASGIMQTMKQAMKNLNKEASKGAGADLAKMAVIQDKLRSKYKELIEIQSASVRADTQRNQSLIDGSKTTMGFNRVLGHAILSIKSSVTPSLALLKDGADESRKALERNFEWKMKEIGATLSVVGGLGLVMKGATQLWEEFKDIAKVGLGGAFKQIGTQAWQLGMSTKDYADIIQQNRDIFAGFGGDVTKFTGLIKSNQQAMLQFGLVGKDAAEATMSMAQSAKAFGISILDQKGLEKSIEKQTKLFSKMSAITGLSIKQLAEQAKAMAENSDIQESLARLSVGERQGRMMDLMQQKQILIMQGLSAEKAQKILESQEKALKSTVKERYEAAIKIQQFAGVMGMGSQGGEASRIMMKGTRASAEEKARLQEIYKELSAARDSMVASSGLAQENLMNELSESLGNINTEMLQGGREQAMTSQNILKERADAEMVKNTSTIGANTQKMLDIGSKLEAILKNGFAAVVAGLGIIALAIVKDKFGGLVKGAGSLANKVGGAVGDVAGKVSGGLGKMLGGGLFKTALKGAGIGMLISGAMNMYDGYQQVAEIFGENATMGQKITSSIGGLISGLTIGLVDTETVAKGLWSAVEWFQNWWKSFSIGDMFKVMWDKITGFGTTIKDEYKKIFGWVLGSFGGSKEIADKLVNGISNFVMWPINKLIEGYSKLFGWITGVFTEPMAVIEDIKKTIVANVMGPIEAVKSVFTSVFGSIKEYFSSFSSVADFLSDVWGKILDKALGIIKVIGGGIQSIVNFFTETFSTDPAKVNTPTAIPSAPKQATVVNPVTSETMTGKVASAPATAVKYAQQPAAGKTASGQTINTLQANSNDSSEIIKKLVELIDINKEELRLAQDYYKSLGGSLAPGVNTVATTRNGSLTRV